MAAWLTKIDSFFSRWAVTLRIMLGAVAFGLALWGWHVQHPPHLAVTSQMWVDDVFRTLQLLTFQFPRPLDQNVPLQLNVARFLLPTLALFETYRLLLASLRSTARLATLGFRRGHIIIVPGGVQVAQSIILQVAQLRPRTVAIVADPAARGMAMLARAPIAVVPGEPLLGEMWDHVHLGRAAMIFIARGSDLQNLGVATVVAGLLRGRKLAQQPLLVVAVEDDVLGLEVDSALDLATRESGLRYRRLSLADEAARALFMAPLLTASRPERWAPLHVVIAGWGPGARAVLRHALTLGQDAPDPPRITVLASPADLIGEALLGAGTIPPFVAHVSCMAVVWEDGISARTLAWLAEPLGSPSLVAVCLPDEAGLNVGLMLAREAVRLGWNAPVIAVHQQQMNGFLDLLAGAAALPGHAWLRAFGAMLPQDTLARLHDEREDLLPRAVHGQYLAEGTGAAQAMEAWDALPEHYRHANRAAADHIAVKLAVIGAQVVAGEGDGFSFSAAECALLARIEHRRWCGERLMRGWRTGPRDDAARRHPDLVPWEALSPATQAMVAASVLAIPGILRLAKSRAVRNEPLMIADQL
jgi:hypothetical protein